MDQLSRTLFRVVAVVLLPMIALSTTSCSITSSSPEPSIRYVAGPLTSNGLTYYTVDSNTSSSKNEVTGINSTRKIVGDYAQSLTGSNTVWQAYTAPYGGGAHPYQSFNPIDWPEDPQGTYMAGISSAGTTPEIEVGYLEPGPDEQGELGPGIWALVYNQGLWSAVPKPGNGCATQANNVSELLAFDGDQTAVGFHSNTACINVPFEVKNGDATSQSRFSAFTWSLNTEATGINASDDIVGTTQENSANGKLAGWYLKSTQSTPQALRCCNTAGTLATSFTGIATIGSTNWISGWYTDSNGTHGLLYNTGASGSSAWTTINEPNASHYTIVNGVNTNGDICGWYKDSSGTIHGFVGLVALPTHTRHRHNTPR